MYFCLEQFKEFFRWSKYNIQWGETISGLSILWWGVLGIWRTTGRFYYSLLCNKGKWKVLWQSEWLWVQVSKFPRILFAFFKYSFTHNRNESIEHSIKIRFNIARQFFFLTAYIYEHICMYIVSMRNFYDWPDSQECLNEWELYHTSFIVIFVTMT